MNHRMPCAAALAVIVLAGAPAFAVENKDVRVVNTPAEAIPVSATGTVALAPDTQVGVANTAGAPLHVVASAAVPDVFVRSVNIEFVEDAGVGDAFIAVPPDKRWVIEQVAGWQRDAAGMDVDFIFGVSSSGGAAEYRYAAEGRRTTGNPDLLHNYILSAPLRAYHDGANGPLRVSAHRSDDPPGAIVLVTVSGYLVDLP